ncbi:MAG TPA: hydroxymethylbilane synthase [Casimicrobiaceae bacterium]|nr:hydroxymethylbilane synthase [Casimicrobiaceae bacterium]
MSSAPTQLLVALRKSALSLCHAQYIRDRLLTHYPQCEITLRGITTQGDRILEKALADVGGKGLFIEEIEKAMREGRADVAVHSLKDMPMEMAPGFTIAAVPVREDPRDALVCNDYSSIEALPDGAIVGTSSLRREAQLREKNSKLNVRLLRGNVNTRVSKLDEGMYEAMILAAAGLNRLGQNHRIAALLDPADFLPAVGQGALAIECAADRTDVIEAVAPLIHHPTLLAVTAERAFSRSLTGSCHTPIAGYATFRDGQLWLRGLLATRDGTDVLRGERSVTLDADTGDTAAADALGRELGEEFKARGAAAILAAAG